MDPGSEGEDDNKRIKIFYDLQKEITSHSEIIENEERNKDYSETEKIEKEEEKEIVKIEKKNNFDDIMKDYELRIKPKINKKQELTSYSLQKKLLFINKRINVFIKSVKEKRSIIDRNEREKKVNEMKNTNKMYYELINNDKNKRDELILKKLAKLKQKRKKFIGRRSKDKTRKKQHKQKKKRTKIKSNYFKIHNHDQMCQHIYANLDYVDLGVIEDWRILFERQIRTILDRKKYPVDVILSTLNFMIERDINEDRVHRLEVGDPFSLKWFGDEKYDDNEEGQFKKAVPEEKNIEKNLGDINYDKEKQKERDKKDKLNDLLKQIEEMKTRNDDVVKKKQQFDELIVKLSNEEKQIKNKEETKRQLLEEDVTNTPKEDEHFKKTNTKASKNEFDEKAKRDKLKIKQRLVKFSFKNFEKLDVLKLVQYWSEHHKNINNKKVTHLNDNAQKRHEEDGKKLNKDKDDKKKEKTDSNIKYEFKKPEKDIRKIIPNCNNLFYIIKNEN